MMLSRQEEQAETRRVFAQDQSLRASTLHQHALADANTPRGRFNATPLDEEAWQAQLAAYPDHRYLLGGGWQ